MRRPTDLPVPRRRLTKRQLVAVIVIAVLVIAILSLRGIAIFYTDYLWFRSVHLASVWTTTLGTKIALTAAFDVVFFIFVFINLTVAERISANEAQPSPEE